VTTLLTVVAYGTAFWLVVVGAFGIVRSDDLVHAVVSLSVAQSGTYVLLLAVGYQRGATIPLLGAGGAGSTPVVDPVVQAMTLTDVVVSATVTALLLALTVQIAKRHGTVDPDALRELRG
jgi:multicomponent Na+:H+ antiporter subunit C